MRIVYGCNQHHAYVATCTFFTFPEDPKYIQRWTNVVNEKLMKVACEQRGRHHHTRSYVVIILELTSARTLDQENRGTKTYCNSEDIYIIEDIYVV